MMLKEKTIVCIGIFLILAILTSCALFYSTNTYCASGRTEFNDRGFSPTLNSSLAQESSADVFTARVMNTVSI